MQTIVQSLSYSFAVILVAACASGSVPVHNFSGVPIDAKAPPTLDAVSKAIVAAGATAGWQMTQIKPGHIIATYKIRNHLAVVDVAHSTTTYDITFKSGDAGLKYDGHTIHENYNRWVEDLERLIRSHVNAL